MRRKKIINTSLLVMFMLVFSQSLSAEQRLILGAKLLGAGWQGNNADGTNFSSDKGGQLGFNIAYQTGKFYGGLNLQNGNYDFVAAVPDQFVNSGSVSATGTRVKQSELDLLLGYYVWPQVSLFMDIKAVTNQWQSNNYKQSFGGLGLGVTGFNPINEKWTLFGSLGFVSGDIKDESDNKVGDGSSGALEVGLTYTMKQNNSLNFGIKFRNYSFQSNDGGKQDYEVNALFVGYTHAFDLN